MILKHSVAENAGGYKNTYISCLSLFSWITLIRIIVILAVNVEIIVSFEATSRFSYVCGYVCLSECVCIFVSVYKSECVIKCLNTYT